jgi:hypothetical protein
MKTIQFSAGRIQVVCGLVVGLASCQVANATLSFTSGTGDGALAGQNYANFDTVPLGDNGGLVESSGSAGLSLQFVPTGQAVTGALSGVYAAPFLSGANGTYFGNVYDPINGTSDATTYLSAGGTVGSEAILTFAADQDYFGLLWGSVDTYNTLSFYENSTLVGQLTGSQVIADPDGNQFAGGTTYVNVTGITYNQVVATSTSYALEFDNVAYSAVPEPTTILAGALLLLPLGASTLRFARRSRVV